MQSEIRGFVSGRALWGHAGGFAKKLFRGADVPGILLTVSGGDRARAAAWGGVSQVNIRLLQNVAI